MNTDEDQKLKQALAKMLSGVVEYDATTCPPVNLWWEETSNPVKDTELLNLCWMVEEGLTLAQQDDYKDVLDTLEANFEWDFIHATWQQRVRALCKVKGVEV